MPRITALRVIILVLLLWTTPFLLYVFLPSPCFSPSSHLTHIQHTLTSGGQVTTVIDRAGLYGPPAEGSSYGGSGYGFGVEWRLSLIERALVLGVGDAKINITDALRHDPGYESAPFKGNLISGDDPESKMIVLSWFAHADSILFDYADHYAEEEIGLSAKVVEAGRVEVWADPWFRNKGRQNGGSETIYPVARRERVLLAALSIVEAATAEDAPCLSQVRVQHLTGTLTSATYGIRKWLLWNFESPIFIAFYVRKLLLDININWLSNLISSLTPIIFKLAGGYLISAKLRDWLRKKAGRGEVEAGTLEAGTLEAANLEAGTLEAANLEAGTLEAGALEAANLEAGTLEAGNLKLPV